MYFSIVVSVFAIVILSVIGALFKVRRVRLPFYVQNYYRELLAEWETVTKYIFLARCMLTLGLQTGSHTMMGSKEDPADGGAVAGAVFGAVFIYIVRHKGCATRLIVGANLI